MGLVTALVCTKDRPAAVVRAVGSLLASNCRDFEVIVIDQSTDAASTLALAGLASDPRVRYVRSPPRGAGAALNEGLRLARGAIVACIDDDCEAPPEWLSGIVTALEQQPTTAVVFSNVVAAPHDPLKGYIPAYERRDSRLVKSIVATCAGHGMSAGMACRRDVIRDFGGFDDALGPGALFPAADDWDIAFRSLLHGWSVYDTADVSVVHYGFRTFAEGRDHTRRDWLGIGAVCAKLLRSGSPGALVVVLWEFTARALWPPFADVFRLRRPRGFIRIVSFIRGLVDGLRTPVDRKTHLYTPGARRPPPARADQSEHKARAGG